MEVMYAHQQHPSTVDPNFSAFFIDPTLRWGSRRLSCGPPDDDQANTKNVPQVPSSPSPVPMKRSKLKNKCDRDRTPAATSKNRGGSPSASASAHDRFNLRSKGAVDGESRGVKKAAKAVRFSVGLSEDEIMADFIAITGKKPPRRPKRPHKKAREYLAGIFPGLGIPENITAKRYRVRERRLMILRFISACRGFLGIYEVGRSFGWRRRVYQGLPHGFQVAY